MLRPRIRLAVLAAGVLALAVPAALAGCGESGGGSKGAETGAKLTMFAFSSSPAEDAVLRKAVDDYNKQGRNTVELKGPPAPAV